MSLIDELICLEEKKLNLLKELKESIQYESCQYHLVKLQSCSQSEKTYHLYCTKSKNLIKSFRNLESFDRFLLTRKIDINLVYQ